MADAPEGGGRRKSRKEGRASKSSKKDKRKSKIDDDGIDEDALQKAKLSLAEEEEMTKPRSEPVSPKMSGDFEEYAGEAEEDMYPMPPPATAKQSSESLSHMRSGKPQVWIKIRPSPDVLENLFEVTDDQKGIRLLPQYPDQFDDPRRRTRQRALEGQTFYCDGVLGNTSQDETHRTIAHDLVEKAMEGISGIIVSVGPEVSGKQFTLFGSIDKFQYRGIIPRSLEQIFQICTEKASTMRYLIRMAIVEVRNDKIRDLLTLGSYEGSQFDRDAPNGMIFQKIGAAEHGLGLLIRALTCQKELPREPYAKPHTLVFVDIYGESHTDGIPDPNPQVIKSRITFAKTAAIPERDVLFPPPTACSSYMDSYGCPGPERPATAPAQQQQRPSTSPGCGNKFACAKSKTGPLAEAIRIRKDLGFLEQMCGRACQYQKLTQYYDRLSRLGIEVPVPPRSQHYRLSKLTYCLKDIVSGNSEIRVLLHVRAERRYKHATLEAMRFVDKVRCVPHGGGRMASATAAKTSDGVAFTEDFNLLEFLKKMPPEVLNLYIQVQPGTFRAVRDHAAAMIDSRIQGVAGEEAGEEKIQELFQNFKSLWFSLMQNVTRTPSGNFVARNTESQEYLEQETGELKLKKKESHLEASSKQQGTTLGNEDPITGDVSLSGKKSGKGLRVKSSHHHAHFQSGKEKVKLNKRLSRKSKISVVETTHHDHGSKSILKSGENAEEMPDETEIDPIAVDTTEQVLEDTLEEEEEGAYPAGSLTKLPQTEVPTKDEAVTEFLTTPNGTTNFQDLQNKTQELRKLAAEHNDAIQETSKVISVLNTLHTELNLIQQQRFLNGAQYDDVTGEILVLPHEKGIIQEMKSLEKNREDLASKMTELRQKLLLQKQEVDGAKQELDLAFQSYAQETYGVTYNETGEWEKITDSAANASTAEDDEERIRKYQVIKRVAKKQARLFLKALVRKPLWVPY